MAGFTPPFDPSSVMKNQLASANSELPHILGGAGLALAALILAFIATSISTVSGGAKPSVVTREFHSPHISLANTAMQRQLGVE